MTNYAGIFIGINEYQFFQPLSYAQNDAREVEKLVAQKIGHDGRRCLLLTDSSPLADRHSTYPNRQNLETAIDRFCGQLAPDDVLWFFFSGYGVSWERVDFLMPIDGKPDNVANTAISMRSLYHTLESCPARTVVFLDINRATGTSADSTIGADTVTLARQLQIPTIISCQHNQFSRETAGLQHGFFTAALLEGLNSGMVNTLEDLQSFLGDRLPQLCEQHFRPRQDPLFIIPPSVGEAQRILPEARSVAKPEVPAQKLLPVGAIADSPEWSAPQPSPISAIADPPTHNTSTSDTANSPVGSPIPASPDNGKSTPASPDETSQKGDRGGKWLFLGGIMGLLFLLALAIAALLTFLDRQTRTPQVVTSVGSAPAATDPPPGLPFVPANPDSNVPPTSDREPIDRARQALETSQAHYFSQAIAQARQVPETDPLYDEAQQNIDRWGQVILDIAIGRAQQQNYQGAIAAAKLVPGDRAQLQSRLSELLPVWEQQYQLAQNNQQKLLDAQKLIQAEQASTYNKAISVASQIPAGQPHYSQAREAIERWSDDIWDIAESRARRRRFSSAIAAARLIPQNTAAYPAAQTAIARWERGQR